MRLHRFYTPFHDLIKAKPGTRLVLDTADSAKHDTDYKAILHQWRDVFNYTAGSQVILFDGNGGEVLAIIKELTWSHAELVVIDDLNDEIGENRPAGENGAVKGVWLFASIVKGDNFDWIIQKTTELGVDHIVPVISDRTIKKNINPERAKKISVEAAEQCGRKTVPVIHKPIKLEDALEKFEEMGGKVFVCAKGGKSFGEIGAEIKKSVSVSTLASTAAGFAIGPEGGWSDREEMYFKRHKMPLISLGENVLRAETAAVAVLSLSQLA